MALAARAPIVGLIDSAGARLEAGVAALAGFGEIFQRHIRARGIIPQLSLIMGPCAGAEAFSPALADFVFMVANTSHLFVTGPDIVRTVASEATNAQELGGAQVHAEKSGLCDRVYANDFEALKQMRRLIDFLPASNADGPPEWPSFDDTARLDPSLDTLIPDDPHQPYDIKELILKTVDEGDFFEIQETHARNIVTGFGRIDGRTVGVVANQPMVLAGVLDADAARKAARFVRFCGCFAIPIITFVDAPGFLPGVAQEHGGLATQGAKLIFAYAEASAPKVTLVTRNAFGGAYAMMGSKQLGGDVNFAWPTARIALIGATGGSSGDPECSPYAAVAHGVIDEVIGPRATRKKIASALATLAARSGEARGKNTVAPRCDPDPVRGLRPFSFPHAPCYACGQQVVKPLLRSSWCFWAASAFAGFAFHASAAFAATPVAVWRPHMTVPIAQPSAVAILASVSLVCFMMIFAAHGALAQAFKLGALEIIHPWSRATPAGAKVAAGYVVIKNDGAEPVRLVAVTVEIAGRAMLHEMTMSDNVMTMRMLPDGVVIPAHGEIALELLAAHT